VLNTMQHSEKLLQKIQKKEGNETAQLSFLLEKQGYMMFY
jgi:hypothetical protein